MGRIQRCLYDSDTKSGGGCYTRERQAPNSNLMRHAKDSAANNHCLTTKISQFKGISLCISHTSWGSSHG